MASTISGAVPQGKISGPLYGQKKGLAAGCRKRQRVPEGRTGYVWWQRGHTPRGRRDVGYQSAWIIGAVCPARDTGVALVLTRLDTAAMDLSSLNCRKGSPPGRMAWC